jgi:hydroxymethylpyrimidine/phosphomethylpyrimidine kinase
VTRIFEVDPELVAAQFDAVVQDIGADAVKTGMLSNSAIIKVVAEKVREYRLTNLVVDPVMVAKSGDVLLRADAIEAIKSRLIPLATVVTPNIPEAEQLTGVHGTRLIDLREAARRIVGMGARSVVIKGGHRKGPATDLFYDGKKFRAFTAARVATRNTHGTGCTFSAAITANLAKGEKLDAAVAHAKIYMTRAIRKSFAVGAGHSPVHHFYRFWKT